MKDNPLTVNDIQYGRQRIILDYPEITSENLFEAMQKALGIHNQNSRDCEYLIKYLLGDQDILNRPNGATSNINNKAVVNFAYPTTREIVGYTYANPTEFIPKDMEYQKDVSKLSDIYNYEDSYMTDICCGMYASTCGISYMITLPNSEISKDMTPDIPLVHTYLDPRTTFIIQSTEVGNPTVLSCHYVINKVTGKRDYTCYTDDFKFEFTNMDKKTLKVSPNPIGMNPITMEPNSIFLMGDWEMAISVYNAINQVTSDAINDIEGMIKALLVVIGAEFEDNDTGIKKVKENRLITLTNGTGNVGNLDAKFIAPQLDSTSVENLRKYLDEVKNIITGIPDRSANSNGGDTGMAVLNRDGWTDIEIVARLKEMFYKKAKKEQLGVGMKILKMLGLLREDITPLDIDIQVGRHTTDNLQTKTQAFSTLVATGELATIDALEMSCLTNKTREVVERGEEAKQKREERALELAKKSNSTNNNAVDKPAKENN